MSADSNRRAPEQYDDSSHERLTGSVSNDHLNSLSVIPLERTGNGRTAPNQTDGTIDVTNPYPCGQRQPHHLTARERAWNPDPNSQSDQAREWRQQSDASRDKALNTDQNGMYQVQNGDSLSMIAMRSLRDGGCEHPNRQQIQAEQDRIVQLNKDAYPELGQHPHLIHPGDQLRMRPCDGSQQQQGQPDNYNYYGDTPGRQQPQPRPEPRPEPQPPARPEPQQPPVRVEPPQPNYPQEPPVRPMPPNYPPDGGYGRYPQEPPVRPMPPNYPPDGGYGRYPDCPPERRVYYPPPVATPPIFGEGRLPIGIGVNIDIGGHGRGPGIHIGGGYGDRGYPYPGHGRNYPYPSGYPCPEDGGYGRNYPYPSGYPGSYPYPRDSGRNYPYPSGYPGGYPEVPPYYGNRGYGGYGGYGGDWDRHRHHDRGSVTIGVGVGGYGYNNPLGAVLSTVGRIRF